jgi:hypothetical protein
MRMRPWSSRRGRLLAKPVLTESPSSRRRDRLRRLLRRRRGLRLPLRRRRHHHHDLWLRRRHRRDLWLRRPLHRHDRRPRRHRRLPMRRRPPRLRHRPMSRHPLRRRRPPPQNRRLRQALHLRGLSGLSGLKRVLQRLLRRLFSNNSFSRGERLPRPRHRRPALISRHRVLAFSLCAPLGRGCRPTAPRRTQFPEDQTPLP